MTQTMNITEAQATNTQYVIERVSEHGLVSHRTGERYCRDSVVVAVTGNADDVARLRADARAAIEPGSSDWIEVHEAKLR